MEPLRLTTEEERRGILERAHYNLFRVRAAEKDLELAYQMETSVPVALQGDVTRLRQILVNLLSNSVKFTDSGEVVLSVSAETQKEVSTVHFSVRDTGIGIPPERMDRLFQAFSQMFRSLFTLFSPAPNFNGIS